MSCTSENSECSSSPNAGRSTRSRRYHCQRCKNHGCVVPRRGHKCPFKGAHVLTCRTCRLVDQRRELNIRIADLTAQSCPGNSDEFVEVDVLNETEGVKGSKTCRKCRSHGLLRESKGHKKACPFSNCRCPKCEVVRQHREVMAQQTKLRRAQEADYQAVENAEKSLPSPRSQLSDFSPPIRSVPSLMLPLTKQCPVTSVPLEQTPLFPCSTCPYDAPKLAIGHSTSFILPYYMEVNQLSQLGTSAVLPLVSAQTEIAATYVPAAHWLNLVTWPHLKNDLAHNLVALGLPQVFE